MNALALSLMVLLAGAPRPPYGGLIVTPLAGPDLVSLSDEGQSLAALSLSLATFERLYRQDARGLIPELAEDLPSSLPDGRILISLPRDLRLHDGRTLGPEELRRALASFAEPGSGRSHLLLPIAGAQRGAPVPVEVVRDRNGIAFTPRFAPESLRLLASARSGIRVPGSGVGPVGTGPYRVLAWSRSQVVLRAFVQHRLGRPFLEEWRVLLFDTAFAARDELSRDHATLAFGPIDGETLSEGKLSAVGAAPQLLTYLRVGLRRPELRTPRLLRAMEQAIDRQRLVRRYMRGPAREAKTLTGAPAGDPTPALQPRVEAEQRATLIVAEHAGPGRRFAERLQLDLVRAGVTARIEVVSERELSRRRRTQDFELAIDRFLFEGEPIDDAFHQLFGLLALSACLESTAAVLTEGELAAFFSGGAAQDAARRGLLATADRRLREHALIIPLVIEEPTVHAVGPLVGISRDGSGAAQVEDAHLGVSP